MRKVTKTLLYWTSIILAVPTYYAVDYFMKLYNEFGEVKVDQSMSTWVYILLIWCIVTFAIMVTRDNDYKKTNVKLDYLSKVCGENSDTLTLIAEILITNQLDLIELFDEKTRKVILAFGEKRKYRGDDNE